ncbi:ATP-binding cassette domain-containing protein [Catenulispora rubra]|uniref:ATP-binding cassette domain-containing protein n=1 Tax=Catenulispora rubra TaxID=280293 RepID=UPI0018927D31|nr:ATP-binding cassette domain-containing protein [Catenulispora rubra]
MNHAFETVGLVKRFGRVSALSGVDLAARPGSALGVLGPNGAGKTTLVRILATLLRPDEGRVFVHGLDAVRQASEVRRIIGVTGQYASIDEDLTGRENLVLIGRLLDLYAADARTRATELLERFGLAEAADRKAGGYSGGMRRRLDLAASLVGRPAVLYLDEPTTGLDPAARQEVWRSVRALLTDGVTVLLTTQYLEEADALADEISVIDHGKVIAHGTPGELKRRVGGQTVVVRPTVPDRQEELATLLTELTGHGPEQDSRGALVVPLDGGTAFSQVAFQIESRGIEVSELALRLPSLDEVFLTLTGTNRSESGSDS